MKRQDKKKWLGVLGAAALLTGAGWAVAQDGEPAAAPAAETAPAAAGGDGAGAAEAPAKPVKPLPSEMMPLAPRSMMLDVVNTGAHLVAVGDRGNILVSNNGKDWAQVQTPVRSPLTAVYFVDDKNGWAVGHDAAILHTADGGKTWELQNFHPELEKPFLDVLFLDASTGFAVGAYGLFFKTGDGGKTWSEADAPSVRGEELHLNSITRLGNGNLFIAGEQGTLGLSADNGATWEKLASPYEASLFGALPVGDKGALIYGLRGNVYITQDVRANNWTKLEVSTVATFFGGTVLPSGDLALVGLNGEILAINPASNAVRALKLSKTETEANGAQKTDAVTSTLSSAIPFGNGILAVGEEGIQILAQLQ